MKLKELFNESVDRDVIRQLTDEMHGVIDGGTQTEEDFRKAAEYVVDNTDLDLSGLSDDDKEQLIIAIVANFTM